MNVLITGATTAQAYQLKKKLQADHIILGDYADLPEFMMKNREMIRLPHPASATYNHEMLALCLDNTIDKVYAMQGQEVAALAETEQLFKEFNITIVDGAAAV